MKVKDQYVRNYYNQHDLGKRDIDIQSSPNNLNPDSSNSWIF